MTNLEFGGLGLLSGLHAASWGAYKDSPYEGFRIASYVRSVLLAGAVALILSVCAPRLGAGVALVGVVYAIERLATEAWKAILREYGHNVDSDPAEFCNRLVLARASHFQAHEVSSLSF